MAQRLKAHRHDHGALELETTEVRAEFEGDTVTGLAAEKPNRARNLIEDFMIAANGIIARFLEAQGFPRPAPRRALAPALAAYRRARERVRRPAPGRARRARPERVPAEAARGRSAPLPGSLADDHQAARARRVRHELPGAGRRRTLRPRGERVHALDRPEPALSGSRHATPRPRGARPRAGSVRQATSSARSPRSARSRRMARRRWSGWCARLRPRVS